MSTDNRWFYTFTGCAGGWCSWVERKAVLGSFLRSGAGSRVSMHVKAAGLVEGLWRERVRGLRELGVANYREEALRRLELCPPAGMQYKQPRGEEMACGCHRLCPWCWARRVVRPCYQKVKEAALPEGHAYVFEGSKRSLSWGSLKDPKYLLDMLTYSYEAEHRDRPGFLHLYSLVPGPQSVVLFIRRLSVAPAAADQPTGKAGQALLAKLVAQFAAYPAGLLAARPEDLKRFLEEVRGRRHWLRSSGLLHGGLRRAAPPDSREEGAPGGR